MLTDYYSFIDLLGYSFNDTFSFSLIIY